MTFEELVAERDRIPRLPDGQVRLVVVGRYRIRHEVTAIRSTSTGELVLTVSRDDL